VRYELRPRGFTLIEIMVAIGIILLLVGMLSIGITFVGRSSKEKATKVTLASAKAMFAELDAKTKLRNQPQAWSWRGEDFVPDPAKPQHAQLNLNFYTAPYRTDKNTAPFVGVGDGNGTLDARDGPDALDAPGVVTKGTIERECARAILNTQLVMVQLRGQPSIRSQLEQLPKGQLMTIGWVGGTRPTPGPDGVQSTGDEIGAPEDIYYFPGNIVSIDTNNDGVPESFKCKRTHQATQAPTSGSTNWDAEQDMTGANRAAPLLVDAFDNPIIFVPAGGLLVRQNLDRQGTPVGVMGETALIKSPDNRPFWASAGPDGSFRNGDDNIYSFEE